MPIDLQIDPQMTPAPRVEEQLVKNALAAIEVHVIDPRLHKEICVRLCGEAESRQLNQRYRGRDKPTNVLSFPTEWPEEIARAEASVPLGDLAVCWPVVVQEATEQGKSVSAHFTHLLVHGVLHLLGHDHEREQQARVMEDLEVQILGSLGFANPY